MNFQEYKLVRESILAERSPLRLDCMNPFMAMSHLRHEEKSVTTRSAKQTTKLLLQLLNAEEYSEFSIPTRGVRSSLNGLFEMIAQKNSDLWLPDDVYPFYWESARSQGIDPHAFSILPSPRLAFTDSASPNCVALLTNPISPLGRKLSDNECDEIMAWLSQSSGRKIILDTVYSYAHHIDPTSIRLFETGQCFITHSLSKAWLERGIFGFLLAPGKELTPARSFMEPPNQSECRGAHRALTKQPSLPSLQQRAFEEEWRLLAPSIKKFEPNFSPPSMGYFTCLEVNYMSVLDSHDCLLIPASVFGSNDPNLSIATCLFNISNRFSSKISP